MPSVFDLAQRPDANALVTLYVLDATTQGGEVLRFVAAAGQLREGTRQNLVPNPWFAGAVPGTQGTLPTGMFQLTITGLTRQVLGRGVEDGLPYVDLRWSGTTSAGGFVGLWFSNTLTIPAVANEPIAYGAQANKIVPRKWAGTPNNGSGLRAADGEVKAYTHIGLPVQEMRIPDSVLRITRHKGRGFETEHPAVFPVALPEFLMRTYTDEADVVFEPFAGSGTTILASQRTGRRVGAIELAPAYVDLAIARWRTLHPDLAVTLSDDGRDYDAVAAARAEEAARAA